MNTKILGAIIAGFVLLSAGAAFGSLYTGTWDPEWNPFAPEPREVLEQAFNSTTAKADHVTMDGNLYYSLTQEDGDEVMALDLNIESLMDNREENKQKMQGNVNGNMNYSGIKMDFGVDFILDQKGEELYDTYIKINKMPLLALFEDVVPQGGALEEQWFAFNASETSSSIEEYSQPFLEEDYVIERLSDEKINGERSYHYRVVFKGEDLGDFNVDDSFGEISEIPVEVWVGKSDMRLRKIALDIETSQISASIAPKGEALSIIQATLNNSTNTDSLAPGLSGFSDPLKGAIARAQIELVFGYPKTPPYEITIPSNAKAFENLFDSGSLLDY